jgi:hypothetical protein
MLSIIKGMKIKLHLYNVEIRDLILSSFHSFEKEKNVVTTDVQYWQIIVIQNLYIIVWYCNKKLTYESIVSYATIDKIEKREKTP